MTNQSDRFDPPAAPFDPLAAAAEMRAERAARIGPKLTRIEQYQAFALLQSGTPRSIVSLMFGITPTTASHLANCLDHGPGKLWRYSAVFREWRRIGEQAFLAAYLTEENFLKAKRLKYTVAAPLDDRASLYFESQPRADSCAYARIGSFQAGAWRFRIDWVEAAPEVPAERRGPIGWRYAVCDDNDVPADYYSRNPNESDPVRADGLWMPWRTSGDAFDYAYASNDLRSPRRPGRPRTRGIETPAR